MFSRYLNIMRNLQSCQPCTEWDGLKKKYRSQEDCLPSTIPHSSERNLLLFPSLLLVIAGEAMFRQYKTAVGSKSVADLAIMHSVAEMPRIHFGILNRERVLGFIASYNTN